MKSIFATAALAAACHAAFASGIYRESFNDGHAQFWDPRPAEAFSIETSGSGNPFYRGSRPRPSASKRRAPAIRSIEGRPTSRAVAAWCRRSARS